MTCQQVSLCLLEKTVFIICACMLIIQIFLSFKNFQRHDYVETHEEDQLYNVDMPMIILCAQTPFKPPVKESFFVGFDQKRETFIGWTLENISTHDYIKSRATVQNISELLQGVWVVNTSWSMTDGSTHLTQYFEPMRITFYDGQCFSLAVPKEEIRLRIVGSHRFIMALGFKEDAKVKVYLFDPNIYHGYFNPAKQIAFDRNGFFQVFDVTLEQIIQSSDDPKVNCQSYAASNSYYNCVQLKFEEIFIDSIKCVPPWFTDDQRKVCQYKNNQVAKQIGMRQGYKDKVLGKSLFFFFILSYNAKKS